MIQRVFKPKDCTLCGDSFTPTSSAAKYCVACAEEIRKEKARERRRKYREAHPEKVLEWGRKYREAHPEKARESNRKHYYANRERVLEYQRRKYHERMAIKRAAQ